MTVAYTVHPYADLWPLLPNAELQMLADDIRTHGLREPIWLHPDGRIVDGRNRYRACALAGVEPSTRTYEGTEDGLLAFLISLNMARRHMDESQRAMVAAKIANLGRGRPSGNGSIEPISQADAARLLNVGRESVKRASKVHEQAAPQLVEAVEAGRVSVSAAAGLTQAPSEQQIRVAEASRSENYRETQAAIAEARARVDAVDPLMAHVGHNSGDNEWYTPREYIKAARSVMGGIDLDPASNSTANEIVGAETYYTAQDDGLAQTWVGRVWMNPPYAQPLVDQFCAKLAKEYSSGEVDHAIVLVNNGTETGWFQTLAGEATAMCFPKGRIRFWHPAKASAAPLQGQAVIYMGSHLEAFRREFQAFGFVVVL